MPHFLSELLCLATPGMGVVVLHWWMYYWGRCMSFCVSLCTNSACLGSLQYWLGYVGKCKTIACIDPHATVFSQGRNHCTQPSHDMPQSMGYSYVQNRKPAVTGHSNGQHRDQYGRWRHGTTFFGQRILYSHVFLHMCKRLSTLNFDFSRKVKEVLWQKLHLFPCIEKPSWVIHHKN